MEKKRYKIKCPVHSAFLSQEDYFQIRAWFCPQCEKYYTDAKGNVETIRIHGKTVSPLPKHIVEAIHRAGSTTKRVFTLNERYEKNKKSNQSQRGRRHQIARRKLISKKRKIKATKKEKRKATPRPQLKQNGETLNFFTHNLF